MILIYLEVGTLGINSGMDSFLMCSHKVCKAQNIQLCILKLLDTCLKMHVPVYQQSHIYDMYIPV